VELPHATVPPAPPSARRATPGDVPAAAALHRAALHDVQSKRGGPALAVEVARTDVDGSLGRDIDNPDRLVLLGCLGDEPVGLAVARLHVPAAAVLTELWVLPAARGVGVGHTLLEAVLAAAREAGCTGLDARALPGDRATKNFFEDHSMVARAITVHTGFGGPP